MMFTLEVNPTILPRSTTRKEWRAIHRWLRVATRRIKQQMDLDALA